MHKKPIILIPGIQGTKLSNINENDFKTIWSGIKKYFSNIHDLKLHRNGLSDFGAENIIERADIENMAYSEIINYLRSIGYRVYIFGYDWRKSNEISAKELDVFVRKIQLKLKENKINFLTHSMGALVFSAYFKSLEEREKTINKVVFTVPPFLGSMEATFNLIVGRSKLFNSSDDFRKVGRTFPGLYELLPVYDEAYRFLTKSPHSIDYYDFNSYWQQQVNPSGAKRHEYDLIEDRLSCLKEVRDQNNFIFNFKKLDAQFLERFIVMIGGGEKTMTNIKITKNEKYKFVFDFDNSSVDDGGDGTVPYQSSTAFQNCITTFRLDTNWIEKRIDSKLIMSDWHSFFLNNGRVQNVIKRFFDPNLQRNENWYQSVKHEIKHIKKTS